MKAWKIILLSLSSLPLIFAAFIFIFFVHTAAELGSGPHYGQTDSALYDISQHYLTAIQVTLIVAMFSVFAAAGAIPLYLLFNRKNIQWWPVAACVLSYAIGWLALNTDTMEWILD